jgi:hypothetical protein
MFKKDKHFYRPLLSAHPLLYVSGIDSQELFLRHVVEVLTYVDPGWLETTPPISEALRQALVSTCEIRVREEQLALDAARQDYQQEHSDALPAEAARGPQERIALLEGLRSMLASLECTGA